LIADANTSIPMVGTALYARNLMEIQKTQQKVESRMCSGVITIGAANLDRGHVWHDARDRT